MLIDTALRYSLACALAYLPAEQLNAGTAEYQRRLAPSFRFREQVTADEYCASATIFEDATDSRGPLLVAFRGSTAPRNYQSMFKLGLVESRLGVGGKVHDGYQARLASLMARRLEPQCMLSLSLSRAWLTLTSQEASLRLHQLLAPLLDHERETVFVGHS